jgi:heme oxygenase
MSEQGGAGLAGRLKSETREEHVLAERSGVMAELLGGRISLRRYGALLHNLRAIYAALEAGLDRHAPDPRLWRPELRRLGAFEQDLGRLDAVAPPLAGATRAYVERLGRLTASDPTLLLAHAYLRYLGDLHGGQVLARLVQRICGAGGGPPTAFYTFGEPARVRALAQDFRAGLDDLALPPARADAFVAEVREGFRLHRQLFEELQSAPLAAPG